MAADARRTAFLNSSGYRVLRFWNNDVLRDIDAVIAAIFAVLSESAPHP
jgi:very-short-patch-repair endonuclease